jgi:phosphoesterase RecJ-like protein
VQNKEEKFKQIESAIDSGYSFLLLAHINMDADAICSLLLMSKYIKSKGKEVIIYSGDTIPISLKFIDGCEKISNHLNKDIKFDTVIVLDCGDLGRTGNTEERLSCVKRIINIDHHPYNTNFGKINYIDATASATCEILYDFFTYNNFTLNAQLATYIYTGILSDTNCLRNGNVTQKVYRIIAELLKFEVDGHELICNLFENYSDNQVKLIGYLLTNFNKVKNYGIYWIVIDCKIMDKFNIKYSELNEMVNYLKIFRDINIAIIFKEISIDKYRINIRSKHGFNIAGIALKFGGGGHRSAAACTVRGDINKIIENVLVLAKAQIDKKK